MVEPSKPLRAAGGCAGALAAASTLLPWTHVVGARPGLGLFAAVPGRRFTGDLIWFDRPPPGLLVALAAVGVLAVAAAAISRFSPWLPYLFATAPVLAVLFAVGNTNPWPWDLPTGYPHLAPSVGYWLAVAALGLAVDGLLAWTVRRNSLRNWAVGGTAVLTAGVIVGLGQVPAASIRVAERPVPFDVTIRALPTQGSLAGDTDFLAGLRTAMARAANDFDANRTNGGTFDHPLGAVRGQHVAFAGAIPGGRAALVAAVGSRGSALAWFVGEPDTSGDRMQLTSFSFNPLDRDLPTVDLGNLTFVSAGLHGYNPLVVVAPRNATSILLGSSPRGPYRTIATGTLAVVNLPDAEVRDQPWIEVTAGSDVLWRGQAVGSRLSRT